MQVAKKYWSKILLLLISVFVIYFSMFAKIDDNANARLDTSFKQALGVFATAKALNAVVSLVQGTEVGPPGVTITIGEVLDPINDLVERFSWIMLASLTSLGIQKILMNVLVYYNGFDILLFTSLVISNFVYFFKLKKYTRQKNFFFKFTILLIFIRFSIPFMSLANEYVYVNFVKQDYSIELSQKVVNSAKDGISQFNDKKASYFSTKYYKNKIAQFQKLATNAGDHIVDLIIIFVFQTILFPLLFLFALYKFVVQLFNFNL